VHKGHVPTQQKRFIGLGTERGLRGLRGRIIGGVFSLVRSGEAWLVRSTNGCLRPQQSPPANPVAVGKAILKLALYHQDERKQELATRCWDLPTGPISPVQVFSSLSISGATRAYSIPSSVAEGWCKNSLPVFALKFSNLAWYIGAKVANPLKYHPVIRWLSGFKRENRPRILAPSLGPAQ
jgi:hypothetical protein